MEHKTQNVNAIHEAEIAVASFNERLAIRITKAVGSMPLAYVFATLACVGLLAILGVFPPLVALLVAWLSQTFLQLVFLPILAVGQNVLSRKQELQSDEEYHTVAQSFSDIEEVVAILHRQDTQILEILRRLDDASPNGTIPPTQP